ncbi:hypothetical protein AB838_10385, partial [Rhodobacteraceae bacterium (ex Bugula neritina AB1)]
ILSQDYDLADGRSFKQGTSLTDPSQFPPEILAGEGYALASARPVPGDNQVAEWGGADWVVRDKNAEELAAERADQVAGMVLQRGQFAVAAALAGILTEQEAEDWAGGNALPAAVTAAINSALPEGERLAARIEALTAQQIRRSAPLITLLQAALALTDDQADALFA